MAHFFKMMGFFLNRKGQKVFENCIHLPKAKKPYLSMVKKRFGYYDQWDKNRFFGDNVSYTKVAQMYVGFWAFIFKLVTFCATFGKILGYFIFHCQVTLIDIFIFVLVVPFYWFLSWPDQIRTMDFLLRDVPNCSTKLSINKNNIYLGKLYVFSTQLKHYDVKQFWACDRDTNPVSVNTLS